MNIIHFLLLMIGNVGLLLLSFILITSADYGIEVIYYLAFIALALLNIFFINGIYSGSTGLSIKRKKLEEEIKIQEAKNRLKALQKEEKGEV